MISALISGFFFGLPLSILTGPLLFAIIQSTLESGKNAGFRLVAGIWISDFLLAGLSFFGFSVLQRIMNNPTFITTLGIIGSTFLILLGITLFFSPPTKPTENKTRKWGFWLTGFLLNTVNPFSVFFWLSVISSSLLDNYASTQALFIIGILAAIMMTDSLKVVSAHKISNFLHPKIITRTRKITGIAILISGIALFWRMR